jgi:hypothetical protein
MCSTWYRTEKMFSISMILAQWRDANHEIQSHLTQRNAPRIFREAERKSMANDRILSGRPFGN